MARQGRLHVPHATYFVVDRFRPGLDILVPAPQRSVDPDGLRRIARNRRRFENLLNYVCTRWGARVHAYCWLPESAQLLIEIFHVPLEYVLHSLRGPLSHFIRERDGIRPPLYAGRYHALLIDPEDFLLDFARHMFWSPVHARLCETPLAYEYSSARACLGEPAPPFLDTRTLAEALAPRSSLSRASFQQFLTSHPSPTFASNLAHGSKLDHRIAGGPVFVREMQRRSRAERRPVPLEKVLSWVSLRLGAPIDRIVGQSRYHPLVRARALVAWLATCIGPASLLEVSRELSCSPSTLHRAIRHYARLQPNLFNHGTLVEFEATLSGAGESHADPAGRGHRSTPP